MIRGSGGGGKGGGGGAYVAPDSLASRAYAEVVDLIAEGEVEGLVGGMSGVYLDGVRLQEPNGYMNFTGVSFAFVPGTQDQDWIPGFTEVDNTIGVSVEVKQSSPIVRTITNADTNAVRVIISIPALYYQNQKNGDVNGTSVSLAIDVNTNGGGYVQRLYDTINAKVSSGYQKQYLIGLDSTGPWDIRVRRITADHDTTGNIHDAIYWASYSEVIYAKLRYPNSAIAALRLDSAQFQSVPQRLYRMRLLRVQVPSNYDPSTRAYSGAWDGTFKIAWTDNPAWCFYDLITNERYGLGQYIAASQVDKWSLYSIGQYCDELVPDGFGGSEPRFTCNCWIKDRQAAFTLVQDLASVFRGMAFWSTGAVSAVQDAPADPVALFTNGNVLNGDFTYQGSTMRSRHTIAMVTWFNMDDLGAKYVEYVGNDALIQKYGAIVTQITAFGCTSRGQAHRVGAWLLYSEQYEDETVSFKTGLDAAPVRPGDVIKVADSVRAGQRMGGRISAATATTITLDHPLTDGNGNAIDPTGATISVMTLAGTVVSPTVQSAAYDSAGIPTLTVSPSMATLPGNPAVWVLDTGSVEAQLFRVIQVAEGQPGELVITALAHNPSKYAAIDTGATLDVQSITDLTAPLSPPSDVLVQETLYSFQASVFSMAEVSWPQVDAAIAYQVAWRKDSGNWNYAKTQTNAWTLNKADPGTYDWRVWSIAANQKLSTSYASSTVTLLGKQTPPSDVSGLAYGFDSTLGLVLSWSRNPDVDIAAYEIRRGASWDSATELAQVNGTEYIVGTDDVFDAATFLVKALSTSGIYSTNAAAAAVTIPAASAVNLTGKLTGDTAVLSWDKVIGPMQIDHYEVSGSIAGSLGTVKGTTLSFKAFWAGAQTFTVKAVDVGGNYVSTGSADLSLVAPSVGAITASVIDNNVLLKWTSTAGTLPIAYYELAQGGTKIGNINGLFATVFETQAATYTYSVTPVDTAGNKGATASISAAVNQPPNYVLHYNLDSDFSGTKTQAVVDVDGTLVLPVGGETFEQHFTNNSWTSPQDQVTAGDPLFIEPAAASGSYQENIDYGAVLKSSQIVVTPTTEIISGAPTVTVEIKTSPDNSTWTTYSGTSAYASNFRYVQVLVSAAAGPTDLARLKALNIKLQEKQISDSGTVTANAADTNGTTVTFNQQFIDVTSITVTPKGTTPMWAIYDFSGGAYPTGFSVYLYDQNGNRASGTVSWTAQGV